MSKPRRHPHLEPGDEEFWDDAGWIVVPKTPTVPEVEVVVPEVEVVVPALEQPKVGVRRRRR